MIAFLTLLLCFVTTILLIRAVIKFVQDGTVDNAKDMCLLSIMAIADSILTWMSVKDVVHIFEYKIFENSTTEYKFFGGFPDSQAARLIALAMLAIALSYFLSYLGRSKKG